MKSINTAFYQVYGEALAPYGYKRLKGNRHPYLVKLVDNEILHIIMLNKERYFSPYKQFTIWGGIATVYRPQLTLDERPLYTKTWLEDNKGMYSMLPHPREKMNLKDIASFVYYEDSEESMISELRRSLEVTQKLLLPQIEKVETLMDCLEFFRKFHPVRIEMRPNVLGDERFPKMNEGMLNLIAYNVEEYEEMERNDYEHWEQEILQELENGEDGLTTEQYEEYKKVRTADMLKRIAFFKEIVNDPIKMAKVEKEKERRKQENTEILRKYGFDV